MLSGKRILEEMAKGNIIFDPFDKKQLNPNSYNVRLNDELLIYTVNTLDMAKENPYEIIKIPEKGLVLEPGLLYLGQTIEYTETYGYVPKFDGRSSIGRLGISVHETAGFGDNGFCGYWTLEISCIQPVRIYPNVTIGQIYFDPIELADNETEENEITYHGKYQDNHGVQPSMMWKEFQK